LQWYQYVEYLFSGDFSRQFHSTSQEPLPFIDPQAGGAAEMRPIIPEAIFSYVSMTRSANSRNTTSNFAVALHGPSQGTPAFYEPWFEDSGLSRFPGTRLEYASGIRLIGIAAHAAADHLGVH
jgi:hypothetical protein